VLDNVITLPVNGGGSGIW